MRLLSQIFKMAKSWISPAAFPASRRVFKEEDINALPPRIMTIDLQKTLSHSFSLMDMVDSKTDGVIVKSVLSKEEIEVIKNDLVAFSSRKMPEVRTGYYVYPKTCFDEEYRDSWGGYFTEQQKNINTLNESVSIDIEKQSVAY